MTQKRSEFGGSSILDGQRKESCLKQHHKA